MIKSILIVVAVFSYVGFAFHLAEKQHKATLEKLSRAVPVQYTTTGGDREYSHGHHCIDMRAF